MLDTKNQYWISDKDRGEILQRALYTHPYYYKMAFPIESGAPVGTLYNQRIGIGKDFFLTEYMGNFGEVHEATGALFNATLYTGYNRSLYRFDTSRKLPTGQLLTEARFRTVLPNQVFDDRQFETLPVKIKQNDRVYGEIASGDTPDEDSEAIILLKGFAMLSDMYVTPTEQRQLTESLGKDVQWEFLKVTVDKEGKHSYILENDRYPRLILGFGAVNSTSDKSLVSAADCTITDISRRIQLTDTEIPVSFIAPRLTCLLDANLYYLPIEYYFQPFAKLQFDVNNVSPDQDDKQGLEIAILTRTV